MTDTTHQPPAGEALSDERLADLRHYWYAVPSRGAEPARTICALLDHIANRDQEIERLRAALGEQTYCASCGVEYPTADQRQIAELQRDLEAARAEAQALRERERRFRSLLDSTVWELEWLTAYQVVQEGGKDWKNTADGSAFFDCHCSENGGYMEWDTNAYIHTENCASGHEDSLGALHDQISAALAAPSADVIVSAPSRVWPNPAGHRFVPLSGSQDAGGTYSRCGVQGCTATPSEHAPFTSPSAEDGPQAICVQCFVVFPISHGEAEWIKEDGVRLLCPECCHDATGIDQWNDGDPSADGAGSGEG